MNEERQSTVSLVVGDPPLVWLSEVIFDRSFDIIWDMETTIIEVIGEFWWSETLTTKPTSKTLSLRQKWVTSENPKTWTKDDLGLWSIWVNFTLTIERWSEINFEIRTMYLWTLSDRTVRYVVQLNLTDCSMLTVYLYHLILYQSDRDRRGTVI